METNPWDAGKYLNSQEDAIAYLNACTTTGDARLIQTAIDDIVKTQGTVMPLKNFEQHLAEQYPTHEDKNRLEAAGRELDAAYMLMKAREAAGLTQQEVADKANIARATVNRIERGIVSPSLETYTAIAQALGKKVNIQLV